MLWLALHLPRLSIEAFAAGLPLGDVPATEPARQPARPPTPALALIDAHRLLAVNAAAAALGVKPGMRRATALALAPQIVLGQAQPARDAQALTAVAHAALAFTPWVVVPEDGLSPHTVLLEVQASLRYFGGRDRLLQRLHAAIAPLGHRVHTASAPTPHGAALLARAHPEQHCADLAAAHAALDAVPVWLVGPGRDHRDALQGMGLRTLADLRRLPRSGLTQRFGQALLGELDRAYGSRPDPREPIVLPPVFESRLELFARADTSEQLLHGARMLLERMVLWLAAQHAFVRRFTLVMEHETRRRREAVASDATSDAIPGATQESTALEIALAEPSRDVAHLALLLRERLAPLQLPAPTLQLRLHAADIQRRAPPNNELFPTPHSEHEGLTRLVERLQARLGCEQIQRLAAVDDHRPERASELRAADASSPRRSSLQALPPSSGSMAALCVPRPVWLLDPPEPLGERQAGPLLDGRLLQLLSGPERIEAGWWDAALAERDYFIAQTAEGALVWIYRARLPFATPARGSGWFLQGRFG